MNVYPWTLAAHKLFTGVLIGQAILALILGMYSGSLMLALIVTVILVSLPLFLINTQPGHEATRHVVAVSVQFMTALHLHLTYGMTELHFEVFALQAFMIFYRDWKVLLSSALAIAVHHIGFYALQASGAEVYVFEANRVFFYILVIHAVFAVVESTVLGLMAYQNEKEAVNALKLSQGVDMMLADPSHIALGKACQDNPAEQSSYGRLMWAFHNTLAAAINVTKQTASGAEDLKTATKVVNESVDTSVDSVSAISIAMNEMAVTINDVAQRASDVSNATTSASNSTHEASKAMDDANEKVASLKTQLTSASEFISSLNEKCQQISDVMNSIQAIAEQTNLLALNAAIEAARAGEQGRGFAVVADEVRNLAGNTKQSTDRIREVSESLINDADNSVKLMNKCVDTVDASSLSSQNAADLMLTVTDYINEVSESILSVASAAEEQSSTVEEISRSTVKLNDLMQGNKSQVDQASVAIQDLDKGVNDLSLELRKFVLQ